MSDECRCADSEEKTRLKPDASGINKRGRPHREWLDDIRYHRMGQGITPGAEQSTAGQTELEEFGVDGIGHLWARSPCCLMM